ncbi:MAG TPA: Wzz/FepE/Etk N-terminal domain-containing protein [Methanothrix sp.]|nr:Wzz/FepE/Etk N-terminal domain-containing protein [Methanothrix sp.]
MDDEIDLQDIFRVLWKRRLLIIGVFLAAVLLAGVICFVMPPVYKISAIITAGNFDDPVYASQASIQNVMLSDEFLLEVFEEINPNGTGSDFQTFKDDVTVKPAKDSDRLIEISLETKKKQEGMKAVDKMIQLYANRSGESYERQRKILSDQLAVTLERLDTQDQEINQTKEALQGIQDSIGTSSVQGEMQFSRTLDRLNSMQSQRSVLLDRRQDLRKQLELLRTLKVIQPAKEPISPIWPRKALIIGIGGILGLMIGIFAAFLREGHERQAE